MSWHLQVCTVIVSTGACLLCRWIRVPLVACVGYPGTSRALGLWRSLGKSGEY